jgi:REP element-mobilizing transposase RayT
MPSFRDAPVPRNPSVPRQPRPDAPGAVHHVWTRGLERRAIFIDEQDREDLLARLVRVLPSGGARSFAWAFVSNHLHAVIQTGQVPLGALLARVNTGFALSFNRRHQRVGYVFQSRFGSRLISSTADLVNVIRYVHLNPLRAGLVPDLNALSRYPWSGHGALMGRREAHAFEAVADALALFGRETAQARQRLAEWMADRGATSVAPKATAAQPDLSELIRKVCDRSGVSEAALLEGERLHTVTRARSIVCYLAVGELGMSVRGVSRALGVTPGAVSQAVRRGEVLARRAGFVR